MIQPERFGTTETASVLARLQESFHLEVDRKGRGFIILDPMGLELGRVVVPLLQALPSGCQSVADYCESLEEGPGLHLVVLIQAGASSLGLWRDDVCLRHKVIKKYVTRGKGKAQTTYLKTKGKSRYGARLRLQNAREHLELTNEKLIEWWQEFGPARRVFYSCPVRMWPELFKASPPPPFPKDYAIHKIPIDVRVPGHEELLRVRRRLQFGSVECATITLDSLD